MNIISNCASLESALESREREIGNDRERTGGDRPGPDFRGKVVAHATENHRGDAQTRDDHRQRERQLDAEQYLGWPHAHAARGIGDFFGHLADAGRHVADQDHQRERDHAYDRVRLAQPDHRDQQREERERRDRIQESADREREAMDALVLRGPDANRERYDRRDHQRGQRDRHVLAQRDQHVLPVIDQPLHRAPIPWLPIAPAATRRSIASMSGPIGRSASSAGTAFRTASYAALAPRPSASGSKPRKSTACAATSSSIAARKRRLSAITTLFAIACGVIGAWSSTASDTGRKSRLAGFAACRISLYNAVSVFCTVAKPECVGP